MLNAADAVGEFEGEGKLVIQTETVSSNSPDENHPESLVIRFIDNGHGITDEGLTITVDRELKEEEKTDRFYRCELAHGALERTVMFPIDVEIDKAKAQLKEGVLEIVIPKLKSVKRRVLKVA